MSSESLYRTSFYGLVQELVDHWLYWEEHREFYIGTLLPQLQGGKSADPGVDVALVEAIRTAAKKEQWKELPSIADEVSRDPSRFRQHGLDISRRILEFLEQGDLLSADRLAEKQADYVSSKEYLRARARAEIVVARQTERERVENLRAKELHRRKQERKVKAAAKRRETEERKAREEARRESQERALRELAAQKTKIRSLLSDALRESLQKADNLNREVNSTGLVDYEHLKTSYLHDWLSSNLKPPHPTPEQVAAIGSMAHSYLLRARAGSGKTSVITAKAILLMKHENIPPDELMILAFNRKAAEEVTRRIRKDYGLVGFNNARTFHSLAYRLVKPRWTLLFDESTGSIKRQSEFLQRLIESTMNPAMTEQIYSFFRKERQELEDLHAFLSRDDYYTYRRNHVQESLRGEHVKSAGEKWIADFLFEHGIPYLYERIWYWDDKQEGNYRPDFSLAVNGKSPDIVIEHWGIDVNDKTRSVPKHWNQTWTEYLDQIERKREYWRRHNAAHSDQPVLFLETSIADLWGGRATFERHLARILAKAGVEIRKLSTQQLQNRVVFSRIARFSTMCLQYIQKAKKQRLSPDDMGQRISSTDLPDEKTKVFLTVANRLYQRYQDALAAQNLMDFDDLIAAAISVIHSSKGASRIRIDDHREASMDSLRWVLIDEYQDFSPLFDDLIKALREYNRNLRLFCVGDDWQAINAFAGSDLRFFDSFPEKMPNAELGHLQNNYRSAARLIRLGNNFMSGKGEPSIATLKGVKGNIELCRTDEIWIEQRTASQFEAKRNRDSSFLTWRTVNGEDRMIDPGLRIGRVLKKCNSILSDQKYDSSTTFAILSRVEKLGYGYANMQAFHEKLKKTLTDSERRAFGNFDNRVRCGTVHSFKGLEADVVILLDVTERNFPKIHPDNELLSLLGVTATKVMAEEERLFYVALTRAKRDLYLLTETGRESEYLSRLGIRDRAQQRSRRGPIDRAPRTTRRLTGMTSPNRSRSRRY